MEKSASVETSSENFQPILANFESEYFEGNCRSEEAILLLKILGRFMAKQSSFKIKGEFILFDGKSSHHNIIVVLLYSFH